MRVCLMIEGQEGVTWEQWLDLARACEEHGLEGLFRSDHYLATIGEPKECLDAWATLAALAGHTERIRLGTLVSPVTFRHPSELAKVVASADHVSGGRVELGLGAGWNEREHAAFGFPFPETKERIDLLAEQIEIVRRHWTEDAFSFEGRHYRLDDCPSLPKPLQRPHPPLIVGGAAGRRSVAIAARFADEYNTIFVGADECREHRRRLDEACERAGREPASLRLSLMATFVVGADRDDLVHRAQRMLDHIGADRSAEDYLSDRGDIVFAGTPEQLVERLHALEEAGVERVYLQHLLHEDLEQVAIAGAEIVPAVG